MRGQADDVRRAAEARDQPRGAPRDGADGDDLRADVDGHAARGVADGVERVVDLKLRLGEMFGVVDVRLGVFGDDYDTPDGTGVRDYIHVVALARGHVKAIQNQADKEGVSIYNLGTGNGYSVLQVVHAFEKACGHPIKYQIKPRRPGDIAKCYCAPEKAKKELSSATTTNINLPFITATAEGPKHFDMNLTRAKFDELTHDLVEMTAEPVRRALSDAGITASELGQVLLVGGSSRIPAVQDKVRQLTGKEPSKNLNPDECVALGASIQGGKLAGDAGAGDILLLDVTPLSLSIETMGGIATRLIERNTTIPTRKSQIFSTAADNQTAVDINVVQGERQFAKDNKSLGQFRLDGIPPARRGVPQIEVTFDIDANGIVNVSAKDLGTGKEQHITITAGSNMSDSDIDKAVKEAAEFEAQDKKRKEAIDTRNNADSMVFQVENALKEAGDKIDANDKAAVEADLNALKDLLSQTANAEEMTDSQVADIKAAQEKMMESAQKLFAKMYEQTQQAGGQAGPDMNMGGGAAGSTDAGNNDDVVDADYKEV